MGIPLRWLSDYVGPMPFFAIRYSPFAIRDDHQG
jgi:hypothetical protein